jgi:aspartate aminotransferase
MHDIWVISDEVYSAFTYTAGGHVSIASFPGMRERAIVINAVSKTYGMTGWRIGYAAAPAFLAEAMVCLQSHTTGNPNSIAQHAAVAALNGAGWLDPIRKEYDARRRRVVDGVRAIRGSPVMSLRRLLPLGRCIVLERQRCRGPDHHGCGRPGCPMLLEEAGVVVMPGTGFGNSQYLRLSFAASRVELESGLEGMARLLGRADG